MIALYGVRKRIQARAARFQKNPNSGYHQVYIISTQLPICINEINLKGIKTYELIYASCFNRIGKALLQVTKHSV